MPARQLTRRGFRLAALACALALSAHARGAAQPKKRGAELEAKIRALVAASGAETAAVAFRDLQTGRELSINPNVSFHAASTMKVPVMLEVYRQAREGRLSLDERLAVRNEFKSIADGSTFSVSPADDSEQTLYRRVGGTETVRELLRLMITESSNLATNIVIERVTPARVMELMRRMGARDMRVLRGVEDGKAFERGLNNTTTARDLLVLLRAIAEGRAVSRRLARDGRHPPRPKVQRGHPGGAARGHAGRAQDRLDHEDRARRRHRLRAGPAPPLRPRRARARHRGRGARAQAHRRHLAGGLRGLGGSPTVREGVLK